jgi:hypothetical protein
MKERIPDFDVVGADRTHLSAVDDACSSAAFFIDRRPGM